MPEFGTGYAKVLPDLQGFGPALSSGMANAGAQAEASLASRLSSAGSRLSTIGSKLSRATFLPLAGGAFAVGKAFADTERAGAALEATLAAEGARAAITTEHANRLADALLNTTGQTRALTLQSAGVIAQFTNVQNAGTGVNAIFDRTIQLSADVAAKMGIDAPAAAAKLARALQDPAHYLGLLARSGITFSDSQKTLIKNLEASGHLERAQVLILDSLQQRFGGVAQAIARTPIGKLEKDLHQLEDTGARAIGGLVRGFTSLPQPVQKIAFDLAALSIVAGPVFRLLGGMSKAAGWLIGSLRGLGAATTAETGAELANIAARRAAIPVTIAQTAADAEFTATVAGMAAAEESAAAAGGGLTASMAGLSNPVLLAGLLAVAGVVDALYVGISALAGNYGPLISQLSISGHAVGDFAGEWVAAGSALKGATGAQIKQNEQWGAAVKGLEATYSQGQTLTRGEHDLAGATDHLTTSVERHVASMDYARGVLSRFFGTQIKGVADVNKAWATWRGGVASSVDFVSHDFATLAGKQGETVSKLQAGLDRDLASMRRFGHNLNQIAKDGTAGAKALVDQLIAMGPAGASMAQKLVDAGKKGRAGIEGDLGKAMQSARSEAAVLEKVIVSAMDNVAAALLVAAGKATTFGNALYAIEHAHHNIFITTHYRQVGSPPPPSAAGVHTPQLAGATGLHTMVDRPTWLLAGERFQREAVDITPIRPAPVAPHSGGMVAVPAHSHATRILEGRVTMDDSGEMYFRLLARDEIDDRLAYHGIGG